MVEKKEYQDFEAYGAQWRFRGDHGIRLCREEFRRVPLLREISLRPDMGGEKKKG